MEQNVISGNRVERGSLVTRLDPRCKLYILLGYVILTLFSTGAVTLGVSTAVFLAAWGLSRISLLKLLKSARSVLILLAVTELISLFWAPFETVGFTFWRLSLITLMSVVFSRTTEVRDILDGLRSGFPITEGAAMSLAIAFDFLPQLGREMEGLKAAAISRGAMLEDGNILERIRDYLPLLIPLFRKTIHHAGELGDAMDLRAYDAGKKRTRMEPLSFKQRDKAALFLLFLYGAVIIALKILL